LTIRDLVTSIMYTSIRWEKYLSHSGKGGGGDVSGKGRPGSCFSRGIL